MSIAYNKYQLFIAAVFNKTHNLSSDTCKVSLSNTAPTAADTYATMIANDIGTANGYTAGGPSVGSPSSTQTTGTYTFSGNNTVVTATALSAHSATPLCIIPLPPPTLRTSIMVPRLRWRTATFSQWPGMAAAPRVRSSPLLKGEAWALR